MTPGQMKVYQYIKSHIAEHGYSPTYQVIADAMGFKSRSQAYQYVVKLVEHGLLQKSRKAGDIQLVDDNGDLLIDQMFSLLKRYRDETPIGNQPAMICETVDEVLKAAEEHIRARALTELARADAPHIN